MKPLVNNEAFSAALDVYMETTKYGPPDEINLDVGDTRSLFTTGRCALTLDWGDIGTLAIDPDNSKVIDKVGAVMLPGSTGKVLDRESPASWWPAMRTDLPACRRTAFNRRPLRRFRRLVRRHQQGLRRQKVKDGGLRLLLAT